MKHALAALMTLGAAACGEARDQRLATPVTIEGDAIPAPLEGRQGDPVRGMAVFSERDQGHCVLCHAIGGLDADFQGDVGPELTGVGNRLTPGQIRLRVADAQRIWPQTVMPSYYRTGGLHQVGHAYQGKPALTAQQIEDLVAYLSGLKGKDDD